MKRYNFAWYVVTLVLIFILVSCQTAKEVYKEPFDDELVDPITWRSIPLEDVRTGDTFVINEFDGKVILVESFAVWCPTCTRQQQALQEFEGTDVVIISLDTDPNEDVAAVRDHIEKNGFTGLYAIAPAALTQSLIEEFGLSVVNAPGAPVVLVCPQGEASLLGRGLKSVDELKESIAGCV